MNLSNREKVRLKNNFGDWAIITGASSGIGLELATQLADAGLNLLIHGRSSERLNQTKLVLTSKHDIEVKMVAADLSKSSGIDKIIQESEALNIGLLINNAGYGTSGLFVDSSLHEEIDMLKVNCEAVLSLTHHFSQTFKRQKRGGIIFLSSLVAFQGVPYAANYAATKAYVQSFAEAIAAELKPFGVSVLAASPGPVESNFGQRANMKIEQGLKPSDLGVPILSALGKQTNVIPGLLSKVLIYSLRTVPRFAKVQIMQRVMGKFTNHQRLQTFNDAS